MLTHGSEDIMKQQNTLLTFEKWGDNIAVRLSRHIMEKYNLKVGDELQLIEKENGFTIEMKAKIDYKAIANEIIEENMDVFLRLKDK